APARWVHGPIRRHIAQMHGAVFAGPPPRLPPRARAPADDVRDAERPVGAFSPAMAEADRAIKGFLYPRMYRHERIMRIMGDAERVVDELFERYSRNPEDIPADWAHAADGAGQRLIADFIAGMTDRYALIEHARLFDTTPELR